jgi:hypothetical protein
MSRNKALSCAPSGFRCDVFYSAHKIMLQRDVNNPANLQKRPHALIRLQIYPSPRPWTSGFEICV